MQCLLLRKLQNGNMENVVLGAELYLVLSRGRDKKPTTEPDSLPSEYLASSLSKQSQQSVSSSAPAIDMDPELARYLNRNYWQQRSEQGVSPAAATTTTSAPVAIAEPKTSMVKTHEIQPYQNGETYDDQQQFLNALQSSVEIFVNRMRSNSQRGRSITNDTSVQSLFNVISNMHPQLLKYIQEQEDARSHYESLQDKLAQLRDAREALDALREDHWEKRRREQEEQEHLRQIQMSQKLEIMRQKKHEYLEMQRQLAFQRLHEQEREYQIRLEQQKHLTQIRQMQAYGYGQNPYTAQNFYSPGSSLENSLVHQMHQQGYVGVGIMSGQGGPPNMGAPQSMPGAGGGPSQQGPIAEPQQQPIPNPSVYNNQPGSGHYPNPVALPAQQSMPHSAAYQQPLSTDSYQPYNHTSSQPLTVPQISTTGQNYSIPISEYSSLSIQSMASALSQASGSQALYTGVQQQQQPYLATGASPQFQAPPSGNMVQSHQEQPPPPPQQQQQIIPPQNEAELISFD